MANTNSSIRKQRIGSEAKHQQVEVQHHFACDYGKYAPSCEARTDTGASARTTQNLGLPGVGCNYLVGPCLNTKRRAIKRPSRLVSFAIQDQPASSSFCVSAHAASSKSGSCLHFKRSHVLRFKLEASMSKVSTDMDGLFT